MGIVLVMVFAMSTDLAQAQAKAVFTVSGTVFYSTTPLPGVTVELIQGSPTDPAMASSTSDANGAYSFTGVAPGSYWIKLYGPTVEFIGWTASTVEVVDSDIVSNSHLPKNISLSSPPSGATVHTLHPTLSWAALPEAASYRLQLNITSDWTLIEHTTIFTNSHTVGPELTPGTKYTWQVDAYDAFNNYVGGTHFAFTMTIMPPAPAPTVAKVTGTVTYREKIALTPGAVVEVKLQDVSRADAPAITIGEQTIENPGQVPIAFEIEYDPADIDDRFSYAIGVRITESGELAFINDTRYSVITRDNPTHVDMVLVKVGGSPSLPVTPPPPPAVGGITASGWLLLGLASVGALLVGLGARKLRASRPTR